MTGTLGVREKEMNFEVTKIEEIDLPNYLETISSGQTSHTRSAPLLAKYRVDLRHRDHLEELVFEVREQPNSYPLIDEYYEDQVYNALNRILSSIPNKKKKLKAHNSLLSEISMAVFNEWEGRGNALPLEFEIDT